MISEKLKYLGKGLPQIIFDEVIESKVLSYAMSIALEKD